MALRATGKRNAALHKATVAMSQRLAASDDETARWVGKDALRELNSASVLRRVSAKRKTLRIKASARPRARTPKLQGRKPQAPSPKPQDLKTQASRPSRSPIPAPYAVTYVIDPGVVSSSPVSSHVFSPDRIIGQPP